MSDHDDRLAVDLLAKQASKLVAEQKALRRRLFDALERDREIDRRVNDCVAGARAFGHELSVADAPTVGVPIMNPAMTSTQQSTIPAHLRQYVWYRYVLIKLRENFLPPDTTQTESGTPEAHNSEVVAPMPKVADVVLDRLRLAGKDGSKASPIESYIETTYGKKIHSKTVGMTLYRLQREGRVRRSGHVWFLASEEAKNPGVSAPGLGELLK